MQPYLGHSVHPMPWALYPAYGGKLDCKLAPKLDAFCTTKTFYSNHVRFARRIQYIALTAPAGVTICAILNTTCIYVVPLKCDRGDSGFHVKRLKCWCPHDTSQKLRAAPRTNSLLLLVSFTIL